MELLCSIMAFASKLAITVYRARSIPFFFYIFVCFVDYIINYESVDKAIVNGLSSSKDDEGTVLINKYLETKIQEWILVKGYLQPKVNLGDLAKIVESNGEYI